eukprot:1549482-Pleurochrysis_carterae.AAC.4
MDACHSRARVPGVHEQAVDAAGGVAGALQGGRDEAGALAQRLRERDRLGGRPGTCEGHVYSCRFRFQTRALACHQAAAFLVSPQALFWDLLDAAAASPYSAHEFQRTHAPAIEARCARQRVRVASIEPRDAAPRKWAQPTGHFGHGIDSVLGRCADRGFSLQASGVPCATSAEVAHSLLGKEIEESGLLKWPTLF